MKNDSEEYLTAYIFRIKSNPVRKSPRSKTNNVLTSLNNSSRMVHSHTRWHITSCELETKFVTRLKWIVGFSVLRRFDSWSCSFGTAYFYYKIRSETSQPARRFSLLKIYMVFVSHSKEMFRYGVDYTTTNWKKSFPRHQSSAILPFDIIQFG